MIRPYAHPAVNKLKFKAPQENSMTESMDSKLDNKERESLKGDSNWPRRNTSQ